MANTYTQLYIQSVFAVKGRMGLIQKQWKDDLFNYITGVVQHYKHKLLAINGTEDHVHVFFSMRPNQSLSDLMQDVKGSSSKWINERRLSIGKFEWQEGFGAFSYSKAQIGDVINYIQNQESHHAKFDFITEYKSLLEKFEIAYDERYIFKPIE